MVTSRVTGSGLYVAVAGVRGVRMMDVEETLRSLRALSAGCMFQVFDASMVAGWRHVFHAAVNGLAALENGYAVSKSLDVEALLYASCQDQISRALRLMGVSGGTEAAAVMVVGGDADGVTSAATRIAGALGEPDDSVLLIDKAKYARLMEAFGVNGSEIEAMGGDPREALTGIIVEKGALLSLRR